MVEFDAWIRASVGGNSHLFFKRTDITPGDSRGLQASTDAFSTHTSGLMTNLGRYSAWIYLAFAVLVFGGDVFHILRDYTRYPFGDHWIWLAKYHEEGAWRAIVAQCNEHRLVIPGILYFLDYRVFGAANAFLIGASVLLQSACAFFLILPLLRLPDIPKPVKHTFAGLVLILAFWLIQGENFYYPFSLCMASANLGIVAALYGMGILISDDRSGGRRTWLWMGGTIFAAFWAGFSYGHGLLIWPLLVVLCWVARVDKKWVLLAIGLCLVAWGLYFIDYHTPTGHASPLQALKHPLRVVHYLTLMMGLPFFGAYKEELRLSMNTFNYVVSFAGILAGLFLCLRFAWQRDRRRDQATVFYTSVMALCLGTALVTALNRSTFPLTQALSGRYSAVPLLFWISLAALLTRFISRSESNGGLGRAIWCGILIAASLGTLPEQEIKGTYFANRARLQDAAAASLAAGMPDMDRINNELARFELITYVDDQRKLTSGGRSLFARPESEMVGKSLLSKFRLAPPNSCSGALDFVEPLKTSTPPGLKLIGWAWNARRRSEVDRIYVTDAQGIVRGLGVRHFLRPDVANALSNDSMTLSGFQGYAAIPPDQAGPLTVFAGLEDGQTVCQIGVPRSLASK